MKVDTPRSRLCVYPCISAFSILNQYEAVYWIVRSVLKLITRMLLIDGTYIGLDHRAQLRLDLYPETQRVLVAYDSITKGVPGLRPGTLRWVVGRWVVGSTFEATKIF